MTDYTRSTGSSGTMMIRDSSAQYVEFWLKAGVGTYNHQLPWYYTINGIASLAQQYDFPPDGAWHMLGSVFVPAAAAVVFKLGDTGTAGLGGPTDLAASILRATRPSAPVPVASEITQTTMRVSYVDPPSGGAAIDAREIAYGTTDRAPSYTSPTSDWVLTGLTSGMLYVIWGRVHTVAGWSDWGKIYQSTLAFPPTPARVKFLNVEVNSVYAYFDYDEGVGREDRILEYEFAWSTTPGVREFTISSPKSRTFTNLEPGARYYFSARARNTVGWSAWSPETRIVLKAGIYINKSGNPKRTVAYINVGGVWKLTKQYVRTHRGWREVG